MKTLKVNFTVPEEVAQTLRARVAPRRRSAFVTAAVVAKLKELEQEELRQALIEGYQARREESKKINEEWEGITLEKWPE